MPAIETYIESLLDASGRKHRAEEEIRICATRLFAEHFPTGSMHVDCQTMRLVEVVGQEPSEKFGVVLLTRQDGVYTATEAHLFLRPVQNRVAL